MSYDIGNWCVGSSETLVSIGQVLSGIPVWPLRHPGLAIAFLERARSCGPAETADQVKELLRRATQLHFFGSTNGHSQELETAKTLSSNCAERETDGELKSLFEEAATSINRNIEELRRSSEEEDDW